MRVTLSPTVQTFGAGAANSAEESLRRPAATPVDPVEALARVGAIAPVASQPLRQADSDFIISGPDLSLDAELQAWLAPVSGAPDDSFCGGDPFCATAPPPATPPAFVAPDFDLAALQRAAQLELTAASAPAFPAPVASARGGLRVTIDMAAATVCGGGADGALHLRFDPRFDSLDPVYVALDRATALALAQQLLGLLDDGQPPRAAWER